MIKKWANGESYAIMLPVPQNPEIRRQVVQNESRGTHYGGESCCEIEHLFYGQESTNDFFKEEPCPGGSRIVFVSDSQKTEFAKEVIPTLEAACFQVFQPMFEFIKSKT